MKSKQLKYKEGIGAGILILAIFFAGYTGTILAFGIAILVAVVYKVYLYALYKKEGLLDQYWKGTVQVAIFGLVLVAALIIFDQ